MRINIQIFRFDMCQFKVNKCRKYVNINIMCLFDHRMSQMNHGAF